MLLARDLDVAAGVVLLISLLLFVLSLGKKRSSRNCARYFSALCTASAVSSTVTVRAMTTTAVRCFCKEKKNRKIPFGDRGNDEQERFDLCKDVIDHRQKDDYQEIDVFGQIFYHLYPQCICSSIIEFAVNTTMTLLRSSLPLPPTGTNKGKKRR